MKKSFRRIKGFVSILTVAAMLCSLLTGITAFADTTSKEPTAVIATPKGDNRGVQIAWKNPTDTTLAKTEVYAINTPGENQTYTLIATDNAPTAGVYTYAEDTFETAVTASEYRFYKVVCTFSDGTSSEVTTYVNPYYAWETLGNKPFIDGSLYVVNKHVENEKYAATAKVELDWEVANEVGPSAHIISNYRTDYDNSFQYRYQFPKTTDGQYLKISFKYKAVNLSGNTYVQLPLSYQKLTDTTGVETYELMRFTGTTDGWVEQSFVRKVGEGCPFIQFNVQTPGDIWIDDVSVYLCDAEGNVSGENLITPTEEYASAAAASAPVISESKAYDTAADLKWDAVSGAESYRVYEKQADNSLALRAEYPSTVTYAKFDNLVNDKAYTYVVKAVNSITKESAESNAATVTPKAPVQVLPSKEPTAVFATPRLDSKGVQLAWKNPTDTTLTKTEVYKINNFGASQTYTLIKTDDAPVAGGYTYARDEYETAYTASTYVYYKLVCTFADNSTTELVTYTDAFASDTNWKDKAFIDGTKAKEEYLFNSSLTNYIQASGVTLDYDVHSGTGPSYHIVSSRTDGDRGYQLQIKFSETPADKTYIRVKFNYKYEGLSDLNFVQSSNMYASETATSSTDPIELLRFTGDSDGWLKYDKVHKAGSNTPHIYFTIRSVGDTWIDGIEVYKTDATGETNAGSIAASVEALAGDYYTTNSRLAAPVISDTNALDKSAELIWNSVTGAKEYRIYKKGADDSLSLFATVPAAQTSIKIDGLTNGTPYTFVVKTVDLAKEESTVGSEVTVTPAVPQVTQSEKEPAHVIATPRLDSKGVEVAWKNPTASTLVKTEVYRIDDIDENPVYTLVATNDAPTAGAYTYARDEYETAYTGAANVFYKLVCSFSDGTSNEVMVYTDAYVSTSRADYPFVEQDVWGTTNGQIAGSTKYWQGVKTALDFDTYAGDKGPSFYVDGSSTEGYADYQLKLWLKDGGIPKDSYAKIEYKIKTNTPSGTLMFAMFCGQEIARYTGRNDWQTMTAVKQNTESDDFGKFFYFVLRGAGEFRIDDVAVYECNENGTVKTGENLVILPEEYIDDSYYETHPLPAKPVISDTEEYDSAVDISWGAVAGATGYEVYEKAEDGAYYLRASVPETVTTVRINNLLNNNAYEFVVKAMDATTKGSEFSAAKTLTPQPDPYKLSEFEAVRNGNNLTVSVDMTNGIYEDGISAQLIVGVYKKGAVVSMNTVGMSEQTSVEITETETLSATVALPSDYTADGYEVRAYVWDGITSMKPYDGAEEITVE